MVDYLDSFALNNLELIITPLYLRDETLVDDGVEVDDAISLKAVTFEGSIIKKSLVEARTYSEGIQGLFDADEVMILNSSMGVHFVKFSEINVRLYEATYTIKVGVKLTGLGSYTYFYPAYDVSSIVEETNDWGI